MKKYDKKAFSIIKLRVDAFGNLLLFARIFTALLKAGWELIKPPEKYPLEYRELLEGKKLFGHSLFIPRDNHIESTIIKKNGFPVFNTRWLLDFFGLAQVSIRNLHPIVFMANPTGMEENRNGDKVIIHADPSLNSILEIEKFNYYLAEFVFSAQNPRAYQFDEYSDLELTVRINTPVNVRSAFPSTECLPIETKGRIIKLGLDSSLSFKAEEKSASAKAGISGEWSKNYTLIDYPVRCQTLEDGFLWSIKHSNKVADKSKTYSGISPITASDQHFMIVFGLPKSMDNVTFKLFVKLFYNNKIAKNENIDPITLEVNAPLPCLSH